MSHRRASVLLSRFALAPKQIVLSPLAGRGPDWPSSLLAFPPPPTSVPRITLLSQQTTPPPPTCPSSPFQPSSLSLCNLQVHSLAKAYCSFHTVFPRLVPRANWKLRCYFFSSIVFFVFCFFVLSCFSMLIFITPCNFYRYRRTWKKTEWRRRDRRVRPATRKPRVFTSVNLIKRSGERQRRRLARNSIRSSPAPIGQKIIKRRKNE